MKVKFKQWNCIVETDRYIDNNRKAMSLVDAETGELIATATVNVVRYYCPKDCAYIKDYSENEGMVDALIEAGIIEDRMINSVPSGHVMIGLYKFTKEALSLYQ